ncbi:MAG TPA: endonuclease [Bacteroidota bacterium]
MRTSAIISLLLILAQSPALWSQTVFLSHSSLVFNTTSVNTLDSASFWIINASSVPVQISDINVFKPVFSIRDTSGTISTADSMRVWVFFKTNQNVTWRDVVTIEINDVRNSFPLPVQGSALFGDSYDPTTANLWDNDLKSALHGLISPHIDLGYNLARDRMFETIDDPLGIDTIECVYTGRRIRAVTRIEAQNQQFNTEHTWPQSTFNSLDPMRADLNHLYPTDETANSMRSNNPFGPVVSNITWQSGGSKLGFNPNGLLAFEPRDIHKGDAARAVFYFMLRYENNYAGYLDLLQEIYLRQWYASDPVSQKEILRNNTIATFQGKRNPLIDHPEFIQRISSFRSLTPPSLVPDIRVSPLSMDFGTASVGDSVEWLCTIVNIGRGPLSVSGISIDNPSDGFHVADGISTIPADSFAQIRIRFTPLDPNQAFSTSLRITSNDPDEGIRIVPITGVSSVTSIAAGRTVPNEFLLLQNYPNPFNPSTSIAFSLDKTGQVSLKVFSVLGEELATLVNEVRNPGWYNVRFNGLTLPSGTYFYRLETTSRTKTRRMILLK